MAAAACRAVVDWPASANPKRRQTLFFGLRHESQDLELLSRMVRDKRILVDGSLGATHSAAYVRPLQLLPPPPRLLLLLRLLLLGTNEI